MTNSFVASTSLTVLLPKSRRQVLGNSAGVARRLPLRALIVVSVLLTVLWPPNVLAEDANLMPDEAREQLKKFERELEEALKKEQNVSSDLDVLNKERTRLNRLLIETAARVQKGEVALNKIEGRLKELGDKEDGIRNSIKDRHEKISKLLAVMQRMGRQPPPVMTTRRDDALKLVRSAMLLASVFPELRAQANRLNGELTTLVTVSKEVREKAILLKQENETLTNERARVKALLSVKKTRILANKKSLVAIQESARKHEKTVKSLNELITKLDKDLKEKAELGKYEAQLAARQAQGEQHAELVPNTKLAFVTPGRMKPAIPFSKAKGLLSLPVRGERIASFGTEDTLGRRNDGIRLKTRKNAQITAPCDGWIVYAGEFRSFGQLLIINAGGGYHVLLAGMDNIDVSHGQFVVAGEPIGTMGLKRQALGELVGGDLSNQSSPVLYIEFRKDGRPIDPDPWWAAEIEKAQG